MAGRRDIITPNKDFSEFISDIVEESGGGGTSDYSELTNLPVVDARAYDVIADGVTDSKTALSNAIDATPTGGTLDLPAGTIMLSGQIVKTRGDITLTCTGGIAEFKYTDTAMATAGNSKMLIFRGTDIDHQISNVVIRNIATNVYALQDGTNRLTTGTLPTQGALSTGEVKLASTATGAIAANSILFFQTGAGAGQIRYVSSYNTGTQIAATVDYNTGTAAWVGTQAGAGDTYLVLLNGGTYPMSTYGIGGIGIFFADNCHIDYLQHRGGWAGSVFQGFTNSFITNCHSDQVNESTIDLRDDTEKLVVVGGSWYSGEGIDCVGDRISILGVHWDGYDNDDQFVDINDATNVLVKGCTTYGGGQAVDIHTSGGSEAPPRGIIIEGNTFENFRDWGVFCPIAGNDSQDVQIIGNVMRSTRTDGTNPAGGIKLAGTSSGNTYMNNTLIQSNVIEVPWRCVEINKVNHLRVINNSLLSTNKSCIYAQTSASKPMHDIQIIGNDIWGQWVPGTSGHDAITNGAIDFTGSNAPITRTLFEGNRIHQSGGMAIRANTLNGVTFRNNVVNSDGADTNGGALFATTCRDVIYQGNIIHNCTTYGLYSLNSIGLTVQNNTVYMSGRNCCYVRVTTTAPIVNNRLNYKFEGNKFCNPGGPAVYTATLGSPSAGTFTLTVNGLTTATIAYNAASSAVQSAIEALANVGTGNVTVSGSAGGPYTVTLGSRYAYPHVLSGSGASLTGGSFAITSAPTTAAQYCLLFTMSNLSLSADIVLGTIVNNTFCAPAYTTLTGVNGCLLQNSDSITVSAYVRSNDADDGIVEYPAVTGLWDFEVIENNASSKTLSASENGQSFSNKGAAGTVTYTLPTAIVGREYAFYVQAAQALRIDPNSTETTNNSVGGSQGGAGKYIGSSTIGDYVRLRCTKTGEWQVMGIVGTWAVEP